MLHTNVVVVETPLPTHVDAITMRLLFLTQEKINLSSVGRPILFRRLQIDTATVALVVAIDEHYHCKSFIDKAS